MWVFIMLFMFLFSVINIIYLIYNVYRVLKLDNKLVSKIVSSLIVCSGVISLMLLLDPINMMIVILHVGIILFIINVISKYTFKNNYISLIMVFIISILYLSYGYYSAHHIVKTSYNLNTQKRVSDLKIVFFSDSHLGTTFDGEYFNKIVKDINKVKPDIVFIGGDFVDDDTKYVDMLKATRFLKNLKTKYGTYFVFGNHDKGYYGNDYRDFNSDDLRFELKKNNIKILEDEIISIDNYNFIGRIDYNEPRKSINMLTKNIQKDKYTIVIDHQPHEYLKYANTNVDLVISGHTHGGQFLPINRLGELIHENDLVYGKKVINNTSFIVSSGISDWAMKFKTGCISEFVVINIKTT